MSLRIWLPLNGNVENKGADEYTPDWNPTSFQSGGKLGTTAYTTTRIDTKITPDKWSYIGNSISFGGLFKFDIDEIRPIIESYTYSSSARCATGNLLGRNAYSGFALTWKTNDINAEGSFKHIAAFAALRSSTSVTATNTFIIESNKWTYFYTTLDYEKGFYKLYIDGTLVSTCTFNPSDFTSDTSGLYNFFINANYIYGGNAIALSIPFKVNDIRIYDECLSEKQIKEISKGLLVHYKLDNCFNMDNLIENGYGELGTQCWNNASGFSTTEIPSGESKIKASIYSNQTTPFIPIVIDHTYNISAYLKSQSTSGNTYPSIMPFDIDKKFIRNDQTRDGFNPSTLTTLSQPLSPGDTVIHATDLSNWTTNDDYYFRVAIFGYKDSTGYVYHDLIYTQDSPTFGTRTDKSHIDKTNNTITLNSAFTGEFRPAGTSICQATDGSTYIYPFGGIARSDLTDWTYKSALVRPWAMNRLRIAKYIQYYTYDNTYTAGLQLIDLNDKSDIVPDVSGYDNNGKLYGILTQNENTHRYRHCTRFNTNGSYIRLPVLNMSDFANSFTITWWSKIADMNTKMAWGFSDGNRLNLYPYSHFNCNTGDGANNPYKDSSGNAVSFTPYNGDWHHYAMVGNGTDNKLYIDGEYKGKALTYRGITGTQIQISGWDAGNNYKWTDGDISDFRLYTTALSDSDIKELYEVRNSIDNKSNYYSHELVEE